MVQFAEFTIEERAVVKRILDRTHVLIGNYDRQSLEMNLSTVHASIGLRLRDLAEASDGNFLHDVCGIMENLDRQTGKLANFFLPRHAA